LQVDNSLENDNTLSIIDEYKEKLLKMEKELERKDKELQDKGKKIAEL